MKEGTKVLFVKIVEISYILCSEERLKMKNLIIDVKKPYNIWKMGHFVPLQQIFSKLGGNSSPNCSPSKEFYLRQNVIPFFFKENKQESLFIPLQQIYKTRGKFFS